MQTPLKVLLLGGTSEARDLSNSLVRSPGIAAILSLAGRTLAPVADGLPVRIGGFGGPGGLADYLTREAIDLVIDATHPFADRISRNAIAACRAADVALLAVERPAWARQAGDHWSEFETAEDAIAALPDARHTIFSALGRSSVPLLRARPQHRYVIRIVDPMPVPAELPDAVIVAARGPFGIDEDTALFRQYRIDVVLAKNSGGDAAYAKIAAARSLRLPVHLVTRPALLTRESVATAREAMAWIESHHASRTKRGV